MWRELGGNDEAFLRCGIAGGESVLPLQSQSKFEGFVQGQEMMQMAQNCYDGESNYEVAMQEGKGLVTLEQYI